MAGNEVAATSNGSGNLSPSAGPSKFLNWEETNRSQQTTGIEKTNLPTFVAYVKDDFSFPSKDLSDQFCKTILELANSCDERGLASEVYGDLDSQTKMCAVVHCIQDGSDTVSVSYAVKTLKTTVARDVQPGLTSALVNNHQDGPDEETRDFLKQTEELLKNDTGVDIRRPLPPDSLVSRVWNRVWGGPKRNPAAVSSSTIKEGQLEIE